jgi:hypothetical protein
MNRNFKKSTGSVLLLAILLFSFAAYITPFAQADRTGVGKFVEIEVIGEGGYVILTKVSSGETWDTRDYIDNLLYEKVGAGLVTVVPTAETGYVFDQWIVNGVPNTEDSELEFKTSKGVTEIDAIFTRIVYTVTVSVFEDDDHPAGGNIRIPPETGTVSKYFEIPLGIGETIDIEFVPDGDNHISALSIDGLYVTPEYLIEAEDMGKDYSIVVFFSTPGFAYIPDGLAGVTYFSQNAGLKFEEATGGDAEGESLEFPEDWATFLWDIYTAATDDADGIVTILLKFAGTVQLSAVYRSDDINELYCDVNNDGVVDGTDNSLVAQAIKTYEQGTIGDYDPLYDVNRDLDLNEEDLHLLHNNYGTILDSLVFTSQYDPDTDVTTISIETDHFSIFRGR